MSRLFFLGILFVFLIGWFPDEGVDAQGLNPAAIDKLCQDTMQSWQVPGLAIAIVKDDRLLYLKGFGVKQLGQAGPITPDTVFPLASCSKSFTSLAVAMLVDEEKMAWDDRVRKHLPFFRLADPLADAQVTLRDLLTHRTGVGGHDLLWYRSPWDLEERIRKIGLVDLETPFRAGFQYQAILYGTAGLAVGVAAKTTWQDFAQKRIFQPLEMTGASAVEPQGAEEKDLAQPHRKTKNKIETIPRYRLDQPDPAGSIHAGARDLAHFLRFQLGNGTWKGKRLLSARNLAEMHAPQIVIPLEGFARTMNPETRFLCYGLGWIVQDYRRQPILLHGGAIDGFRAHFTLVPEAHLGIALLNNLDGTYMNLALSNTLVDLFLGFPYKDWNGYYQEIEALAVKEHLARARALRTARHPNTKPSRPLKAYAGTYFDKAYGPCRVFLEKDTLVWEWGNLRTPLEHFHFDTFLVNTGIFVDTPFVFHLGADGEVQSLRALDRTFSRKS